jgi:hypothetical protein
MKHTSLRRIVSLLSSISLAMGVAGCASPGGGSPRTQTEDNQWWHESEALVRNITGRAEISGDSGQNWEPLRSGQVSEEGQQLRTGPESEVRLDLGEHGGGIVKVMPESLVIFEQLGASHTDSDVLAIMNLPQGRVIGDTLKMPANRKITVKTPAGGYDIK